MPQHIQLSEQPRPQVPEGILSYKEISLMNNAIGRINFPSDGSYGPAAMFSDLANILASLNAEPNTPQYASLDYSRNQLSRNLRLSPGTVESVTKMLSTAPDQNLMWNVLLNLSDFLASNRTESKGPAMNATQSLAQLYAQLELGGQTRTGFAVSGLLRSIPLGSALRYFSPDEMHTKKLSAQMLVHKPKLRPWSPS